jgi:DNA polymerase III subunit chi
MAELLFYHLQRQRLEAVLAPLLEKTLEKGWRAVVQGTSQERLKMLDDWLWTYADDGFLPHTIDSDGDVEQDPVVLTLSQANPNAAEVRFLVDGATVPDDPAAYERLVVIFDGNDEEALAAARQEWKRLSTSGHSLTYWQQSETGRWERKA